MKSHIYKTILDVCQIKLGLKRLPFFVSWSITARCPYKCIYCSSWQKETKDLDSRQINNIVEKLAVSGTRRISFTGGEPFLRKDLDEIVGRATEKGILVSINSSGFGVKDNKQILKKLINLTVSLDGYKDLHNLIRGDKRSYDKAIEAAYCAKEAGIKLKFFTVINKFNLNAVDFLLEKAEEFKCSVMFQPASPFKLRSDICNPVALSSKEIFNITKYLMDKKRKGYKITNSFSGLKCMQQSYVKNPIKCWGGRAFFRIEPDGTFKICPRIKNKIETNCIAMDIKSCIRNLSLDNNCLQCLSAARVEFNCIFCNKIDSFINFLKS
jgi:MoaA/NifB/PqqE/SkfB family radical SAM enzyme